MGKWESPMQATGAHPSELNREVLFGAEVMSDPSGASAEKRNRPRSKADSNIFVWLMRVLEWAFICLGVHAAVEYGNNYLRLEPKCILKTKTSI